MQPSPTPTSPGLNRWADWFSPGRFAFLLGLLVVAMFPQVVFGEEIFVARDFGFFAYPLAYFQRENFSHGHLPFWNPYNNCGVPFLAQWNTMPLYPPALLYLLLPLRWALGNFCLLHLWFAGLGMYWLARRWTGSNFAAAFAGTVFAFNGFTLNLLMWPSHIATFSWMPWVVLMVERAWQQGGRKIPLAALVGALQMLAGGPETILFTWLILLVLWLAQSVTASRSRADLALLWRFPLVSLLVAGLAAAQLLPFLDLAAHSQREEGYADTRWSMPGSGWANFLVPMVFGRVSKTGIFFQYDQGWTSSYYLGTGTLLLALLALWLGWRKKDSGTHVVWLLVFMGAVALFFSFGDQLALNRFLRRMIPQLSFITYPIKYVTVAVFVTPLLAAIGLARLNATSRGPLAILWALLQGSIALVLIWAWHWPHATDDVQATLDNGLLRAAYLVPIGGVLMALVQNRGERLVQWAPLCLILMVWLDVVHHMPQQNPTVRNWLFEPGLARSRIALEPQVTLGGPRAMVSPFIEDQFMYRALKPQDNFLVKRLGYFADANLLDQAPKVNGFFSLYPRECDQLNSILYGSTNADFPRLMDFMGVSQVAVPGEPIKWQTRDTFHPLVTAGQRPFFYDDTNTLVAMVDPRFDSTKLVFLAENARHFVTVTNATRARVLKTHFTHERVDIEVQADEPSVVVVAQTYYHRWQAYVDGGRVRLWRANYAFQALEVPAGSHSIKLVYEDDAFKMGAGISLFSLLACFGLAWKRH